MDTSQRLCSMCDSNTVLKGDESSCLSLGCKRVRDDHLKQRADLGQLRSPIAHPPGVIITFLGSGFCSTLNLISGLG